MPPRLGLPISQHFIALDPANGYNRVVHLADVGDVNGDNFRAVDIVWSTSSANRAGEPTMKRVILFGSRRLAWRSITTALKAGGAKKHLGLRGLPTERDQRVSGTGAYMGTGQVQTADTRDDLVEVRTPCADSEYCSTVYTASRLIITTIRSGKVAYAYGEDWGYNSSVLNLDYRISSAQTVRRFGRGGRPVVVFSSPTEGARVFGWIYGHMAQVKLRIDPRYATPIVIDMNGDGVDEIVGVAAQVGSRRALGIVIVERRRN